MNHCAFRQSGGTLLGFILGLVIGLGIAVAVALYITNAPVPFVTKVKPASEAVNPATAGDPNKPLFPPAPVLKGGTGSAATADAAKGNPATDPKAAPPPPEKGTPPTAAVDDGSRFLLQAGAFKSPDDADAMRARLALLGFDSKIFPREQDGTTLYRVRMGPYGNLDDVNRIRKTMAENGIDVQLIRLK
jgi:cell division protein FtsN